MAFIMSKNIATEDNLYDAKMWMDEFEERTETKMCAVPCETRLMMGRSWYKCRGYLYPCSCAEQAQAQNTKWGEEPSIIGRNEIIKKLDEFYKDNGIQEPEVIDIGKLEATFGMGCVKSVSVLAEPEVKKKTRRGGKKKKKSKSKVTEPELQKPNIGALLDADGQPIHFKYSLFACRNFYGTDHDIQTDMEFLNFVKYIVDKYPNWDRDDSWKNDDALQE